MISVIIPTYKNSQQLFENLKVNKQFLTDCQVIVVNDDPSDSLTELLKGEDITLVENKANCGFAETMNRGVAKAKFPYLFFLNDDVVLENDHFKQSVELFKKNKNLFAVSYLQKEKNEEKVGKNTLFWKRGLMFHGKAKNLISGPNGWAEGGAALVDKYKFDRIGGFDNIFRPFYWEDIDLSYRAWRRGYSVFFDPEVSLIHHHESTIGTNFSKSFIKETAFRNQHIFILKNIGDPVMLLEYVLFLPFNILYYLLKGQPRFVTGFFKAVFMIKRIIRRRNLVQKECVVADQNILKLFV